jgi:septal ring factor EnvC (AmiA/AmiB activator)
MEDEPDYTKHEYRRMLSNQRNRIRELEEEIFRLIDGEKSLRKEVKRQRDCIEALERYIRYLDGRKKDLEEELDYTHKQIKEGEDSIK